MNYGFSCFVVEGYDFPMLRKFCKMFPLNAVARIVSAYFRHKGLPLKDETDEEKEKAKEKEKKEKKALAAEVATVPVEDPLDIILVSLSHQLDLVAILECRGPGSIGRSERIYSCASYFIRNASRD